MRANLSNSGIGRALCWARATSISSSPATCLPVAVLAGAGLPGSASAL